MCLGRSRVWFVFFGFRLGSINRVCTCVVYLFQTIGIPIAKQYDPRLYNQADLSLYVSGDGYRDLADDFANLLTQNVSGGVFRPNRIWITLHSKVEYLISASVPPPSLLSHNNETSCLIAAVVPLATPAISFEGGDIPLVPGSFGMVDVTEDDSVFHLGTDCLFCNICECSLANLEKHTDTYYKEGQNHQRFVDGYLANVNFFKTRAWELQFRNITMVDSTYHCTTCHKDGKWYNTFEHVDTARKHKDDTLPSSQLYAPAQKRFVELWELTAKRMKLDALSTGSITRDEVEVASKRSNYKSSSESLSSNSNYGLVCNFKKNMLLQRIGVISQHIGCSMQLPMVVSSVLRA